MSEISPTEWDAFLANHPNPHILQSTAWGQLKSEFGWQLIHVTSGGSGAQILIKQVFPGVSFGYIPKGPIGPDWNQLWPEIDAACKRKKCAFLKVEPDTWISEEPAVINKVGSIPKRFIQSKHFIQPVRTLVVDLSGEEALILGRMKQKARYNINLALKKNIIVTPQVELTAFYELMKVMGQRDQFGIHSPAYYQRAFELFHAHDQCQLLVAEFEGTPISALVVFRSGSRAWYFYGASSNEHREKMPNYLIQWEAMRWAKLQGCTEYDLWGVPDENLDTLEANFSMRSDGLWGVYRFKRGFGGELKRSVGAWDRIYNRTLYRLYSIWTKYKKIDG